MKTRVFGCKKFGKLLSEQADRSLSASEERFLERHREACVECQSIEHSTSCALNMLRMAALEPEIEPMFEDRIIRRLKVQQVKESLNYWSPALVGAGIACIVIFVTLQMVASPVQMHRANLPSGEAKRELTHKLELDSIPVIR